MPRKKTDFTLQKDNKKSSRFWTLWSTYSPYVSPLQRFFSATRRVIERLGHKIPSPLSKDVIHAYSFAIRPFYLLTNFINWCRELSRVCKNDWKNSARSYQSENRGDHLTGAQPMGKSMPCLRGETQEHKVFRERAKLVLSAISFGLNIAATIFTVGILSMALSTSYYLYSVLQTSYIYKKKREALNAHLEKADLLGQEPHTGIIKQLEIRKTNLELKKLAEKKIFGVRASTFAVLATATLLFNFVPGGTFIVAGIYALTALYAVVHAQKIRNEYKKEKAKNLSTLEASEIASQADEKEVTSTPLLSPPGNSKVLDESQTTVTPKASPRAALILGATTLKSTDPHTSPSPEPLQ